MRRRQSTKQSTHRAERWRKNLIFLSKQHWFPPRMYYHCLQCWQFVVWFVDICISFQLSIQSITKYCLLIKNLIVVPCSFTSIQINFIFWKLFYAFCDIREKLSNPHSFVPFEFLITLRLSPVCRRSCEISIRPILFVTPFIKILRNLCKYILSSSFNTILS